MNLIINVVSNKERRFRGNSSRVIIVKMSCFLFAGCIFLCVYIWVPDCDLANDVLSTSCGTAKMRI